MIKGLRKAGRFVIDAVEEYIPFAAFSTLFVVFLLGIIFRYFFKPLTWTLELSLMCFIWTALLGGLFAKREDAHVKFTMVYDLAGPRGQTWMRIIGHVLLVTAFGIGLVPSWKYVMFMGFKKSNVLKIPMNIVFFPFVVFLAFMMGRYIADIVRDVRSLAKDGGEA